MKKVLLVLIICLVIFGISACANSHNHMVTGELIVVKEATCAEMGVAHMFCTECGDIVNTISIPKTSEHSEVVIPSVESTCTTTGLSEGKKCSVCDTVLVAQQETPIIAHTYDDKYDESCNVCGFVRDAECAHRETETIKGYEATCTSTGLTDGYKCKKCGEILVSQEVINANGHSFGDWIIVEQPTAEKDGFKERYCICGCKESKATVSEGLAFDTSTIGTGYKVVGIGDCEDSYLVIPSTYNGRPVVEIGYAAFDGCDFINEIYIPESINSIEGAAFYGCSSIKSITIPYGVKTIRENVFSECTSLEIINLPNSITGIANLSIYGALSLKTINFAGTIYQWNSCYKGSSFDFDWDSNSGNYVIYCADGEISKDGTITYYETASKGLEFILNDDGLIRIGSCTDLDIVISNTYRGLPVTSIGNDAFYTCESITSIEIPNSVTSIGYYAFENCTSLTNIKFEGTVEEWNAIEFDGYWNERVPATEVICSDGTVLLN